MRDNEDVAIELFYHEEVHKCRNSKTAKCSSKEDSQWRTQNPVKHLGRSFLRKQSTAESRCNYFRKILQMFDWVLNASLVISNTNFS